MEMPKLRAFYEVAKTSSLTLAAAKYNCSVSNISRQIGLLEKELDTTLFDRNSRKLSLTAQGAILFQKATEIFNALDSTKALLRHEKANTLKTLKISGTNTITSVWLPPKLKPFMERYPDMHFQFWGDDTQKKFSERHCDIYIGPSIQGDKDIIQHYVMTSHMTLYASKEYLEQYGTPRTLEDLDHHKLIARNILGDLPAHAINWHLLANKENTPPRLPWIIIPYHQSLIDLALDGLGIACLSNRTRQHKQDQLIEILPHIMKPTIDICFIYANNSKNSGIIQCFYEYLLEAIAQDNPQ
jgi:DNA-binding transcriptional LysR family regulator